MITETLRALADILRDPVTGVNAVLPTVPIEPGDAPPEPVSVHEETTSNHVALGAIPDELLKDGPVIALHNYGTASADTVGARGAGGTPLQVLIRFAATPAADSTGYAADVSRANATLRAVRYTISRAFVAARNARVDIERNGITLDEPIAFDLAQISGEGAIVAGLIVTIPANDPWSQAGL